MERQQGGDNTQGNDVRWRRHTLDQRSEEEDVQVSLGWRTDTKCLGTSKMKRPGDLIWGSEREDGDRQLVTKVWFCFLA